MTSIASSSQTNQYAAQGGQAKIPIQSQKSGPLYTGDVNDASLTEFMAIVCSFIFFVLTFPITICNAIKVIQEYERAVIFRMGRIKSGKAAGPGAFFILPCTDEFKKVDLRTITFDVPPQEVLTKDSVTVNVDAIVFYRIFDPTMAVVNVSDVDNATKLLSASILRNILGTKKLQEIMSDREGISTLMRVALDEATDPWGVRVERVEIKDYRLPPQMVRAMASEAEATREAKAKLIGAEAEVTASKALKGASDALSASSGAIQLRYMQTLSKLAQGQPSMIYFPLPLNMLQRNVREYERVVVFRNGRLQKGLKGPGVIHINPITDKCITLDMRSLTHDIPRQEVLTQDSVTVQVDAIIYYKISDPVLAVTNVINYNYSTGLLSAALLRTVLGMHSLSEVLEQRQKISAVLLNLLDQATDAWGIRVDRVELKNVRLPTEMQRVMAAEAEATRDAKAKIVAAEGELQAAKALKDAATVLANSPGGIQIRLLQTLEEVGATNNSTVVIPFPAEILRAYAK